MSDLTDREARQNILSLLDPFRKNAELATKSLDELKKMLSDKNDSLGNVTHEQYDEIYKHVNPRRSDPDIILTKHNLALQQQKLFQWEQNLVRREDELALRLQDLEERERKLKLSRSRSPTRDRSESNNTGVRPPDPVYREQLLPSYNEYQPYNYTPTGMLPNVPDQGLSRNSIYNGVSGGSSTVERTASPTNAMMSALLNTGYDEDEAVRQAIRQSELEALQSLDSAQERLNHKKREEQERKAREEERIREEQNSKLREEERLRNEAVEREAKEQEEKSRKEFEDNLAKSKYILEKRPLKATEECLDELIDVINTGDFKTIKTHLSKLDTDVTTFRQYLANNSPDIAKCFLIK